MAATKSGRRGPRNGPAASRGHAPATSGKREMMSARGRPWVWLGTGLVLIAIVLAAGIAVLGGPSAGGATTAATGGSIVQARGGQWTNIAPDSLASMMRAKDFTLLNVKTPYIGEIAGTDLYIPYTEIAARAAELPTDKSARIVVYCWSGNESAIAAQTLLDLGYTNIDNLDGGMTAWLASGRDLVQVDRS